MAREKTYRFLPEYAKDRIERFKREMKTTVSPSKDAYERAIFSIEATLTFARRGLLTLDEAMKDIASVDVFDFL